MRNCHLKVASLSASLVMLALGAFVALPATTSAASASSLPNPCTHKPVLPDWCNP